MKIHSLFNRLLQKSYVLFLFALLISLVIWVYMSLSATPTSDTTLDISDVPIQIEPADESGKGFQAFGADDAKATVTVSGDRTVLGLVNKSDLIATASAGTITSAGNYTLPVSAKKVSNRGNFDVTSWTPTSITVFLDYYEEKSYDIQKDVTYHTEENYDGQVSLSPQKVTVSGPRTEVQKVDRVVARASVSEKLKASLEVDTQLVLLDQDGAEVSQKLLQLSTTDVKANITVLPKKTVKVEPEIINKPGGIKITEDIVKVEPSELILKGPSEALETVTSVKLDTIDFAKLKNEKITLDLDINIPADCTSISSYTTAKVTIDLSGFAKTESDIAVEKFKINGLSDKYNAEITTKSISVTVYGSESDIEKLNASQITAVIDASNFSGKIGSVQLPVSFSFEGADTCWAYTTEEANVTITKKE